MDQQVYHPGAACQRGDRIVRGAPEEQHLPHRALTLPGDQVEQLTRLLAVQVGQVLRT